MYYSAQKKRGNMSSCHNCPEPNPVFPDFFVPLMHFRPMGRAFFFEMSKISERRKRAHVQHDPENAATT